MMQSKLAYIFVIFLLLMSAGCSAQSKSEKEQDLIQVKSLQSEQKKKVIYILVDSLLPSAIDRGIQEGMLPNMKQLIEHGQYYKDMVTSFPTMSVTIDSSLFTGAYADKHGVPGLTWYSTSEKRLINYGTGPIEILKIGVDNVLEDAIINLNGSHLSKSINTIYEDLHELGLKSSSINGLIYRGNTEHTLTIPSYIEVPTSLPSELSVYGPDYLSFGSFSDPLKESESLPDRITERLGFNNEFSIAQINYLIKENKLPDFSYVYLPDLDQTLHKNGPSTLKGLKDLDEQLGSVIQSFGSIEEALSSAIIIITGDSGVSQIKDAIDDSRIQLTSFFNDYEVLKPNEDVSEKTQLVLAVNETMAYIYALQQDSLSEIADILSVDPRIDVIAWKEGDWIHATKAGSAKVMRFHPNGNLIDPYNQSWTVENDAEVLDLKINTHTDSIEYGLYPDGLKRLSSALNSHDGRFLVVTCKSGYELAGNGSPTHEGGGGHGALDQEASLIPLIISGTDKKPEQLRIVDLKSYILNLLK